MRKLKYAVIGVGGVGKSHLNAAMDLEEYEIVAVADVNEEFGKMAAEQYKAKWYKDYNKMLEKEELDVVSICTPHFLHSKMSIDTLNAGVNVLVEKPMAIRVSEADEMINVAKKNSVTLGVVFQHRFDPEVQYSRNIKSGYISMGKTQRRCLMNSEWRDTAAEEQLSLTLLW